ncbi:hypothetical protein CAPTEDRAFT_226682 [Capitella teleta]|uniref:Uncharacterized protein n=1 Tax=Capitella teleta TaxID=283909 RepID=R7TVY4_CAPTE|nr:hypothetical protein CAPTEDRAFT_226682 [Capitella teleta]|eukprot:ELT97747.1 hypothetical protein CAPTEDRAFT_226682 [Capitella teleta]
MDKSKTTKSPLDKVRGLQSKSPEDSQSVLEDDDDEPEDLTQWAENLGYITEPSSNRLEVPRTTDTSHRAKSTSENSSMGSALLNVSSTLMSVGSSRAGSASSSPSVSRKSSSVPKPSTPSAPHKQIPKTKAAESKPQSDLPAPSREEMDLLLESFRTSVNHQRKTADQVARKFLIPMGSRIHKHSKTTLAEMTRHFRLDRIVETLEGILWIENELTQDNMLRHITLDGEMFAEWNQAVADIKTASDKMARSWGALSAKGVTPVEIMPSHTLEQKITKLHNSVETVIKSLLSMVTIWSHTLKNDPTSSAKVIASLTKCRIKAHELEYTLPQKYVLDAQSEHTTPLCTPMPTKKELAAN